MTDITYIHVKPVGWTYLASVMDLYSRKILGYSYGKKIDAELATKAVKNACLNIKNTDGMILQNDLGSQYTSDIFENCLNSKGIKHSFSRKGNPYDNACIESFHSLLKKEMIYCNIIPLKKPNLTFSNISNPGTTTSSAMLFWIIKLHRGLKIML